MERDIMRQLAEWKEDKDRKPLLITGVRQCGKTYVMKSFGEQYFEDVAYFNFEGNEEIHSVFSYNFDVKRIVDELGNLIRNKRIVPGKTLVIFDEIQACPRAITSLKYFCENLRQLHIVCAGSLLGVAIKRENVSFPVGKIDRMQMYPMSFSEFLRADGGENLYRGLVGMLQERELSDLYTVPLEKTLKLYYIVGGMPEAVSKWVKTHDFKKVEKIQDHILEDYGSDFSKHAPKHEVPKLGWIWESIPKQLAKENNKFIFSHVREGKRSKDLEDALVWLEDAGLVYRLELVEKPELPLSFCADATYFKVYMSDVGLLRRKSGISPRVIIQGAEEYQRFKGALTENFVLTELKHLGRRAYFWRSGNSAEVDFLIEDEGRIIPIEAKADVNTKAKSYTLFCKRYHPRLGFKFSMKNVGEHRVENTLTYSVPLYLIWKLERYLQIEDTWMVEEPLFKELWEYSERELAGYMLEYIHRIEQLQSELEPILHHEIEVDVNLDKRIRGEYQSLEEQIREDARRMKMRGHREPGRCSLYREVFVLSILEAADHGFSASWNGELDYNYWGGLEEARYRLTKYDSKREWEDLRTAVKTV